MSTTAMSTTALEEKLNRYRGDYAAHKSKAAFLSERLTQIKKEREEPAHLERIVAGNHDAIRLDDTLAKEQVKLEREINAREKLAAGSRRAAEELQPQIEQAHVGEIIERITAQAVTFENSTIAIAPLLEALAAEIQTFEKGPKALEVLIGNLPEREQAWVGRYFLQNFAERFRSVLLSELSRIVAGQSNSAAGFLAATSAIFSNVHRALATIAATAAGGAVGRKMYRLSNGAISGLSGGLTVAHGEQVCLPDDAETQKFIGMGVLELIANEEAA